MSNNKKIIAREDHFDILTKGKTYTVIREKEPDYYVVENDEGNLGTYFKSRFIDLDCNICVDRKCNSCPMNKNIS